MDGEGTYDAQRRRLLTAAGALGAAALVSPLIAAPQPGLARRPIPGHDELIPAIGMGSWLTFDVDGDERARDVRLEVLRAFFAAGGTLIDSSPMYGSSEQTIGWCLERLAGEPRFAATKVWKNGRERGIRQMQRSEQLWRTRRFDLMQVHNLLDWRTHLDTLRAWRDAGRIRYLGVTTSHGRRHSELAHIIRYEPDVDFVQFTYNLADREAEHELLPLAAEQGKAVIINRPFRRRQLINALRDTPLPDWAAEIRCRTWAQYLLKFIISHPAVTCAIPATSRVDHMNENMQACTGPMPDASMRRRMVAHFESV